MAKLIKIPCRNSELELTYLQAINGILGLTDKELKVLDALLAFSTDSAGSHDSRMYVRKLLKVSRSGIHNYLKQLAKKNVLTERGDVYEYNPIVIPDADGVNLKFVQR